MQLDTNLDIQWVYWLKGDSSNSDYMMHVASHTDGYSIIGGCVQSSSLISYSISATCDMAFMKVNSTNGRILWAKVNGGSGSDYITAVDFSPD